MFASLLAALRPFGSLPAPALAQFAAAWQSRTAAEGELLFRGGPVCAELFFVEQGVLRLVARPRGGREITHSFRHEGQLCTLFTSFAEQVPTPLSIQAACPARVLAIGRARLEEMYQQLPALRALFGQLTRQQLAEKLDLQRAYLGQDAAGRYATLLARQPEVAGRVPQHMVASYLGITPQSLSRLRRQLAAG